jgi:ubiquinone/menaquinone biosynthesis C-methylase UbiE
MSKVTRNFRKPVGILGNIMIKRMNKHHSKLTSWGLSHYNFSKAKSILDIGCGGGNTIELLLQKSCAKVFGMDHSPLCVKKATARNFNDIKAKRTEIAFGNVLNMNYFDNSFDIITAVETIYFWQPIKRAFEEVFRVLSDGGKFVIINELSKQEDNLKECEKLEKKLNLTVFTENELKTHIESAGFAVVNIYYKGNWMTLEAIKN